MIAISVSRIDVDVEAIARFCCDGSVTLDAHAHALFHLELPAPMSFEYHISVL